MAPRLPVPKAFNPATGLRTEQRLRRLRRRGEGLDGAEAGRRVLPSAMRSVKELVMTSTAAALFDVDGTLVDSSYLHTVTWWEALRQGGYLVPMARVHRAIGLGSGELLDHLLGAERDRDADGELDAAHQALYAAQWPSLEPLPGAARLLRACTERGWTVVLATSASAREVEVLRRVLDADDAIADQVHAEDVDAAKPAPDLVEQALAQAGADAGHAVFVGDTAWDVQAAHRAGVPSLGVLSGGWSRAELADAGAAQVYRDVGELADFLHGSLLADPTARDPAHARSSGRPSGSAQMAAGGPSVPGA